MLSCRCLQEAQLSADLREDTQRLINLCLCVRRRVARTQEALIGRAARRQDNVDVEASAQETLPQRDGLKGVSDQDRDDW